MPDEHSETRHCLLCGREFEAKRYWQRFHSESCRNTFHTMTRERFMAELKRARAVETSLRAEIATLRTASAASAPVSAPGNV